jgi:hypothetical protein
MRRPAVVAMTGVVATIASLASAGPAMADIGGPSIESVAVVGLIIVGAIVAGVVAVCILVLRSIARSREEKPRALPCRNCGSQVPAGAPYCLTCGAPQSADRGGERP